MAVGVLACRQVAVILTGSLPCGPLQLTDQARARSRRMAGLAWQMRENSSLCEPLKRTTVAISPARRHPQRRSVRIARACEKRMHTPPDAHAHPWSRRATLTPWTCTLVDRNEMPSSFQRHGGRVLDRPLPIQHPPTMMSGVGPSLLPWRS